MRLKMQRKIKTKMTLSQIGREEEEKQHNKSFIQAIEDDYRDR
jgi:hypothetical protein